MLFSFFQRPLQAAYEEDVSHELTDVASWDTFCPVNGQYLCVAGVHATAETMNGFAKRFAKDHLRFMHVTDASEKNNVFDLFKSSSTDPALLVVNRKRARMAIGGATSSFLDTVISGSAKWVQEEKVQ